MSDKFNYVFDKIAIKNLNDLFDYVIINLSNPTAANLLYNDIFNVIEQIRTFPECGELIYPEKGVRKIPINNYILYYIPIKQSKTIYIIKITHGKQKFENENLSN